MAARLDIGVSALSSSTRAPAIHGPCFRQRHAIGAGAQPDVCDSDFSGEASFDPSALGAEHIACELRFSADSLEVTDDIKSKDRREMESTMNQKVLETAKYPEIVFREHRACPPHSWVKEGFKAEPRMAIFVAARRDRRVAVPAQVTSWATCCVPPANFPFCKAITEIPR